jgi:uncharacterized phage protein gp47/JayE
MAYFAPYIDDAGLHIPFYTDIRDDLIARFKSIYGQDIYLDNDSQDYQMISAFALKTYDTMQLLQIVYNNRSPKTAVGSALDGVIKLNGIKRKAASYSTCVLTLTGTSGTTITNGVVEDDVGVKWNLPDTVTLAGTPYQISAISTEIGAIEAAPGTITKIVTPTKGWVFVTNEVPAVVGAPVETNEALRQRQTISVANPSQALIDGTIGGIASVAGVSRYKVYENDTNLTDANGIPGHSIAAVVEGGLDAEVAEQIYFRKGPGSGTYGDFSVEYINSDSLSTSIRFFRPGYAGIDTALSIKKNAGYVADMKIKIEEKIQAYIESLNIGTDVTITGVLASVLSLISDLSKPPFSIVSLMIGRQGGDMGITDVEIAFQEVTQVGMITVTEV